MVKYLDDEKKILNQSEYMLRHIILLRKLNSKKEKKAEAFFGFLIKKAKEPERWILSRTFLSSKIRRGKEKDSEKFELLKSDILDILKRQYLMLTGKDLGIIISDLFNESEEYSKGAMREIYELRSIKMEGEDADLILEEIVKRQPKDVKRLGQILIALRENAKRQYDETQKVYFSPFTEKNTDYHIYETAHGKMRADLSEEEKWLKEAEALLKDLEKIATKIAKENREIKQAFNPQVLKELKQLAGEELYKQDKKLDYLRHLYDFNRRIKTPIVARYIVAVHLTRYFPEGGVMKPAGMFRIAINKKGKSVPFLRNTLHFALNGPTPGFGMYSPGLVEESRFAILIPLETIIDRVVALGPPDTMVFGRLELPKGSDIITVEQDYNKVADMQKRAGKATVIQAKKGENTTEAVKRRIKERGFTLLKPENEWNNSLFGNNSSILQERIPNELLNEINYDFNRFVERLRNEKGTLSSSSEIAHYYSFWSGLEHFCAFIYFRIYGKRRLHPETVKIFREALRNYLKVMKFKASRMKDPEEKATISRMMSQVKQINRDLKKVKTTNRAVKISAYEIRHNSGDHPICFTEEDAKRYIQKAKEGHFL